MIKQNKVISGLHINDTTHLLSQYADDTQIYLDGTKSSLDATFATLNQFRAITHLKVFVDKAQAVWLEAALSSPFRLGYDNLHWAEGKFKVLGVAFSCDMKTYVETELSQ